MFDRIKAKEKSKTLLRTRNIADAIGFAVILCAIAGIGMIVLSAVIVPMVSNIVNTIAPIGVRSLGSRFTAALASGLTLTSVLFAVWFVGFGILLLFRAGMNRAALRINRGDKNVRVLDIILAGDRLGKYIAITLWQVLFVFLWNLPTAAVLIISFVWFINNIGSTVVAAFAVIFVIAACIWSIYITINKACQYYYAYCVAEDNRELTALDCIRESGSLMVDHKWELFVTKLSFIGWDMIASLPFGNVFVIPYKYLTYTSIYEQLIGSFKPIGRSHMQWLHNSPNQLKDEAESGERMVEILSGEFAGATLPVKAGEDITIGRDPKRANVVTSSTNTSISGLHCRIRYDEQNGKYIVIDHSTNGTYLNNEKLAQERGTYAARGSLVKLADGAMILRLS